MADFALFWDIGLIIVTATFLAYLARILRQPLVLAYMLAGILLGPLGLSLIKEQNVITILSEFGIAFLLFIVGLELDLRRLRDLGIVTTVTTIVKSVILFFLAFNVSLLFGFSSVEAIYLGLVLSFSSTMVVIKLLSDKGELDTLHGRMILGILLTEDVLAILILSVLSTPGYVSLNMALMSLLKGVGLFSTAILLSRYILPTVFGFVARSQELLFLTALSLCFLFAKLADVAGFSVAIGAFIAGVAVATFPYNLEIISRIHSLRDFFATLFFVSLGMEISVGNISALIYPLAAMLILLLVVKTLVIMLCVSLFGYSSRSSFLTAISLTQVSEFSLIIALTGMHLKHISADVFSLTALLALVSITLTSYFIKFDNNLYSLLNRSLIFFERLSKRKEKKLEDMPKKSSEHIIVCGAHRMGYRIIKTLIEMKEHFLVVDFNPEVIKSLLDEGVHCVYGDIGDMEILRRVNLAKADMIISTIPAEEDSMLLIEETKKVNPRALVFVTADTLDQALELYDLGADYVFLPRMLSGDKASELITRYTRKGDRIMELKRSHIESLEYIKDEELLDKYEPSFLKSLEKKFNGHSKRKSLRTL
jgi:Kef-type K+ transport system membrane component KefB/Trk K+ transport system NAD-binding subunit